MESSQAVDMTSPRRRTLVELGRCTPDDRQISRLCIHRITSCIFHFHTNEQMIN